MCRKNQVPSAFLIGLGAGLLLRYICGGAAALFLAVAAIVGGVFLVKN